MILTIENKNRLEEISLEVKQESQIESLQSMRCRTEEMLAHELKEYRTFDALLNKLRTMVPGPTDFQRRNNNDEFRDTEKRKYLHQNEVDLLTEKLKKIDARINMMLSGDCNTFSFKEQMNEALRAARVFTSDLKFKEEHETKQISTGKFQGPVHKVGMFKVANRDGKSYTFFSPYAAKKYEAIPSTATVWASYIPQHKTYTADVKEKQDKEMARRWDAYQYGRMKRSERIVQRRREAIHA